MKAIKWVSVAMLIAVGSAVVQVSLAQTAGIGRTELERSHLVPGHEVLQVRVDFAPGAAFGRHTHPGDEIAYVLEGTLEYQFDDKPSVRLKAGDVLFIPAGTVHSARNVGTGKAQELATYVVKTGRPLVVLSN